MKKSIRIINRRKEREGKNVRRRLLLVDIRKEMGNAKAHDILRMANFQKL